MRREQFRKYLIENPTEAEVLFRDALRREQIQFKFQKRIKKYIFDFHLKGTKILIELDGSHHKLLEFQQKDAEKEWTAIKRGYQVIRLDNIKIYNKLDEIIKILRGCPQIKHIVK